MLEELKVAAEVEVKDSDRGSRGDYSEQRGKWSWADDINQEAWD